MINKLKKMVRLKMSTTFSARVIFVLCIASFLAGSLLNTARTTTSTTTATHDWTTASNSNHRRNQITPTLNYLHNNLIRDCSDHKQQRKLIEGSSGDLMEQVAKTHQAVQSLDKSISTLEMELSRKQVAVVAGSISTSTNPKKVFVVIGINTAFSSKKRRDSIRDTWMPTGDKLKKLEKEKGMVMRFVIGHSAGGATTTGRGGGGGMLDKAIDEEDAKYKDFLRLKHVEGYHELSTKTRLYFSTAFALWDADFYVKVDDDVHLNLGMLSTTLHRHRSKPRIYIGCMKSGPVLSHKGVRYHEPEFWKFGEEGNKYFRHATGQIYAISKDLAAYISINLPILHRYANEDVSLGSWFIGLEVEHVDERSMCCGTPPDCEWKAKAGNVCVASFDWSCSGICKSVERMKRVHSTCGEGDAAVWNTPPVHDHL